MLLIDRKTLGALNDSVLRKYKRTAFSLALLLTVCGMLCLLFPIAAGVALSYFTGALLVACGIYSLICAYTFRKSGKIAIFCLIIFGIIYAVMGVCVFMSPILGMNILSATICFLFLLAGLSRLSAAFRKPAIVGRYWCMLIGLLDLIIAFVWMGASEDTTYILASLLIGMEMISSACIYFTLCKSVEQRLEKTTERQL